MFNVREVKWSLKRPNMKASIRKLNKDEYVSLRTGEIKNFVKMESRADDKNNVRVTLSNLRDLINSNVDDPSFCKWITLTYAQPDGKPMTDPRKLYNDFKIFNILARRKFGHYEYIVAMEPQGSGSWHAHMLMFFPSKAPYMANDVVAKLWRQGFVTVKKLVDCDNVGAYLTAYLGDMNLDDVNDHNLKVSGEIKEVYVNDEMNIPRLKRFVKGARLCFYPPGFNLYRCSRGIKRPVVEKLEFYKVEKLVKDLFLTYERTYSIEDSRTGYKNTYNDRYYNTKRKAVHDQSLYRVQRKVQKSDLDFVRSS